MKKEKALPVDLYLLFFILFIHILLLFNNLARPYFVLLGIFDLSVLTSISLIYIEIVIVIIIALLYLRRVMWAKQLGVVFYAILIANTVIGIIPFLFFRIELAAYLRQVMPDGDIFHVYIINLFANLVLYVLVIMSLIKNRKFLKYRS